MTNQLNCIVQKRSPPPSRRWWLESRCGTINLSLEYNLNQQSLIEELKEMLHSSKRVVVFTGAGISTESGIPDFRSPGGLWSKYQPIDFREFMTSHEARKETWRRKIAVDRAVSS